MKEDLISFETAKLAKERGFDLKTDISWVNYYTGEPLIKWKLITSNESTLIFCEYSAPTQSLLQKWLREVKCIDVFIRPAIKENHYEWLIIDNDEETKEASECFSIYEQALEAGLQEALKLIKK